MSATGSRSGTDDGGDTRRLPLALGILAFVVAAAVLAGVTTFDVQRWFVYFVALVTLLIAGNAALRRRDARTRGSTPDPEHRNPVPTPGDDLGDAVDQFRSSRERIFAPNTRIQEGLHDAALAVLTRFRGLSTDEAEALLEDGTWTDDPHAAAFLSSSLEAPKPPLRVRIVNRLTSDQRFQEQVRRTAAAVAAVGYGGLTGERSPAVAEYDAPSDTTVSRTAREPVDGVVERASRRTGHWTGIGVVALVAIGIGAFVESPAIVMAGAVGIGYAAFANAMEAPIPDVTVERTTSEDAPEPGDELEFEVTITNESGRLLPDVRFVDGIPPGLAVTDGPARIGTSLRPGESVTLEYTVTARRGTHAFDPALLVTRDLFRSSEREFLVGSETTIVCEPVLRPVATGVPLRTTAAMFSGRLTTGEGGSGTQFHSVREYRRNDPLNRIDWNRHARTGELATLQFHEERAARVLVLVDARKANYVAHEPNAAHAVDRSTAAAGRIAASLLADGDTVGLAAIGPLDGRGPATVGADGRGRNGNGDEDGDGAETESDAEPPEQCWLPPGSGHTHRIRFQQLLATHPQFSTMPPPRTRRWSPQLRRIHRQLSSETQVVLLTPLCDRTSAHIVRWLEARGHAVSVVSPDPTAERTTGQQLARVARRIRQFDLQREGIPIIDWTAGETIDEAFARAQGRGSGRRGDGRDRSGGRGATSTESPSENGDGRTRGADDRAAEVSVESGAEDDGDAAGEPEPRSEAATGGER